MKCFLCVNLLLVTAAFAQQPPLRDLAQARNLGMGGAFRALGAGTESIVGNPAAMTLSPRYQTELSYGYDVNRSLTLGNASVMDSTTPFAAGLSYHFVTLGQQATERTAHVNTLAIAFPLFAGLSLGVSGKHLLMQGAQTANAITLDAGLVLKLFEVLSLGFSGHNLVDIQNPDMTRYYALGLGLKLGPFIATADAQSDFLSLDKPLAYAVGAELSLIPGLPLRAGYSRDAHRSTEHLSAGVSLEERGNSIDFGYRHELGGEKSQLLAVSLRFKLQ